MRGGDRTAVGGEQSPHLVREQEVLVLLCQRLTDPQFAQRLFLSPRTASRHVGAIMRASSVRPTAARPPPSPPVSTWSKR